MQEYAVFELYIDRGDATQNKLIFDHFFGHREEIESTFGGSLSWERLDAKRACRIKHVIEHGGYRTPENDWPIIQSEMVDGMCRLEMALKTMLDSLTSEL